MLLAQEIMLSLTGSLIVLALLGGLITEAARKSQSPRTALPKSAAGPKAFGSASGGLRRKAA